MKNIILLAILIIILLSTGTFSQIINAEISKNAPDMSKNTLTYLYTWEAEDYKRITGYVINDKDASNGKAVIATLDEAVITSMMYGENVDLPEHNYVAFIRMKAGDAIDNGSAVHIDVTANGANTKIAEINVTAEDFNSNKYTVIPIFFKTDNYSGMQNEVRIFWNGLADITLDKIDLYKIEGELPQNMVYIPKRIPLPTASGFPNNLTYVKTSYPTKDIFPTSNNVSDVLTVIDIRTLTSDWQLALTCLQGLVNREKPELYIIHNNQDEIWLNYLLKEKYIKDFTKENEPEKIIDKYKKIIKGIIVTDPAISASINVCTTYSGVYDVLPCSEKLAKTLDFPIKLNTKGLWKNNAEAYNWAYDNMWDKVNHYVGACLITNEPRDYMVENKIFCFWLPGTIDGSSKSSSPNEEIKFAEKLLANLAPNTPIMGFPGVVVNGNVIGYGELEGVGLFAEFGHFLVGSVSSTNLSIHSGFKPRFDFTKQNAKRSEPTLDKDKKYIAFTYSDGDNLPVLTIYNWPSVWDNNIRGKFPVTWHLAATSKVLIPAIMDYYYSTATENDLFACAASGVGYTHPNKYGIRFKKEDRAKVYDDFLSLTSKYMQEMDMKVIFPTGVESKEIGYMAEKLNFIKGFFPDYSRKSTMNYEDTFYLTANNISVLHAGTRWDPNLKDPKDIAKKMIDEIRDFSKDNKPAFIHAFVWNWGFDLNILNMVVEELGDDYVFLNAEDLAYVANAYLKEEQIRIITPSELGILNNNNINFNIELRNLKDDSIPVNIEVKGIKNINLSISNPILNPGESININISGAYSQNEIQIEYTGYFGTRITDINVFPINIDNNSVYFDKNYTFISKYNAERLSSNTGIITEDIESTTGKVRATTTGISTKGGIIYGPYASISEGDYIAVFRIKRLDDTSEKLDAVVDVISNGQNNEIRLANDILPVGEYKNIVLPFTTKTGTLETRVLWNNGPSLAVDCVYIFKKD